MKPLSAILLDFGGTLDSNGVHWSTQFAQAFAAAGVDVERDRLDRAFLSAEEQLAVSPAVATFGLGQLVAHQVELMLEALEVADDGVSERITDAFMSVALTHLSHNKRLLEEHRTSFRYGLVSNFTANLEVIVAELGLDRLLDSVMCSQQVGVGKPDPGIFEMALQQLETEPEATAMVGDSLPSDIMPAKALGMTTFWIRGDRVFGRGDESAADYVVESLADVFWTLEQQSAEQRGE